MNPNSLRRALIAIVYASGLAAAPLIAQENAPAPAPNQQQPPRDGWQGRGGGGGGTEERQLEHLTTLLNLTPDQIVQVKAIQAASHQQMESLHGDTTLAPADKRARMMSIRQTARTNIRNILTNDQKTKFDAMQARMQERRAEHEQGGQAPPPPPPPPAN